MKNLCTSTLDLLFLSEKLQGDIVGEQKGDILKLWFMILNTVAETHRSTKYLPTADLLSSRSLTLVIIAVSIGRIHAGSTFFTILLHATASSSDWSFEGN